MFFSKYGRCKAMLTEPLFQSLFSWMFFSKFVLLFEVRIRQEFQSLFSWMFFSKFPAYRGIVPRGGLVSILVLLDVFLEVFASDNFVMTMFCFNPCSLGCFSRSSHAIEFRENGKVSILVLLDVFLEDPPIATTTMMASFNPCSLGCFSRRGRSLSNLPWFLCFNPCSLGCFSRSGDNGQGGICGKSFNPCSLGCFSRRRHPKYFHSLEKMFQSLFSWMFFSKITAERLEATPTPVSILVLLDVFLEVWGFIISRCMLKVSILVLLDVFLEAGKDRYARAHPTSFNPCSLGCFSRSRVVFWISLMYWFQSLFSWMFFSKQAAKIRQRGYWCVSILVLLDVFLEAAGRFPTAGRSVQFQSLFSWMFFSKTLSTSLPAFLP